MKNEQDINFMASKPMLAAGFSAGIIASVKKHIDKNGMPERKEKCPLREEFRTRTKDNTESSRITWLCRVRTGIFLSDWKCVGLNSDKCVMCVAGKTCG